MTVPKIKRPDFSQSLVHLTRDRIIYKDTGIFEPREEIGRISAFEVLKEILTEGVIRGSGNEGYVKGNRKAVCLSEIPISSVHYFASPPEEEDSRYSFYGIAMSKKAAFEAGARPVIYLPDGEAEWIPKEQKWRHVQFRYGSVDFTHEREWRSPDALNLKELPGIYVLVWEPSEAKEIYETAFPVSKLIRGVMPMKHIITML